MKRLPHWAIVLACTPLVLLAGCPQQKASAPVPPQAAAPATPAAAQTAPTPIPSQAVSSAQDLGQQQHVQQLIRNAQNAYASGVRNYRAGRLEAARSDFDSAVDMMLTSGMDLKRNHELSDEFDKLLSSINSLEMSALKEGNGFSPAVEAAPLDTANEVTFPPDAALTAKVTEELKTTQSDLPLVVNDYVTGFINYFTNSPTGHAHLLRSLERAGKYQTMIAKDLRDAGVPQDLIYLAVAESGFQPQALNRGSGAGGMWQFMPTSAYGLERNGWVDERLDPEKSSLAYARYMKELYNQFGDWYLAMAAYDWGPGNVQRAVMRTGYADFWELYKRNALPGETKNYVPGIIAAAIMAKNPKQYGLDNLNPDPAVVSDTVTVNYSINLRLVADLTEAPVEEIVALNPSLLRMTTPDSTDFDLHVPVGSREMFLKRVAEIPDGKRTSWRFHVVQAGETLETIAGNFRGRASEIAKANSLDDSNPIAPGDGLVIPVATAASLPRPLHYVTRAGDTLVTIADRFNVSVEQLRRWNHLSSSRVGASRSLYVSEPVRLAPATHTRSRRTRGAGASSGSRTRGASTSKASSKASSGSKTAKSAHGTKATSHAAATKKKPGVKR